MYKCRCPYLKSGRGIIKDSDICPEYVVDSYSACFLNKKLIQTRCLKEEYKGIVEPKCWNIKKRIKK